MSVKYNILLRLEAARGSFVSGQELAEALGVTRSAVWKGITALRAEGAEIESVTNRGYRLCGAADLLSPELVSAGLPEKYGDLRVTVLETVDSTNNEAKRRLIAGLTGPELIIAARQTAGRGRMGREFYSPADTGLYMSLALRGIPEMSDAVYTTTAAAVAVVHAVETLTDKRPLIKWVNDIWLDGRKICGILTEAVTDFETGGISGLVIGIGVNLRTDFSGELGKVAASVGDGAPGRAVLAAAITGELLGIIDGLPDCSFLDDYRKRSLVLGKPIRFTQNGETKNAVALDIDDRGGLVVKLENGQTLTLSSGEISVRPE